MADITYTKNISGKLLDIDWFNLSDASLQGQINFQFGDKSRRLTGLDKMVQKWLWLLLTPAGSDMYDPNHGTEFYNLRDAATNNHQYITATVNSAIADATEQLRAIQQQTPPTDEDEWFSSASLLRLEFGRDSATIYIRIINRRGLNRSLTLPTPMSIG